MLISIPKELYGKITRDEKGDMVLIDGATDEDRAAFKKFRHLEATVIDSGIEYIE